MDVPEGVESLVGRRFGRLEVIGYEGMDRHHATLWLCACDCGREKVVHRRALLNGTTQRCGRNCPFDTGMVPGRTFGSLTLRCRLNDSKTQTDELWLCDCECGNQIEVTTRRLRRGSKTSCGCNTDRNRKTRKSRGGTNGTMLDMLSDRADVRNKTGVRGVYQDADGRYRAGIVFRGRKYSLGGYARLEDAARVRAEAERLIWGPAVASNGEECPSHAECVAIVADIRKRWSDATIARLAEPN